MKRVKVKIDVEHTLDLIAGEPIAIKVPKGAEILELLPARLPRGARDSFAHVCDVFLNGRPA